jgi:8-oxo-dGTP pyrophosphatase MutT (NUDIX family)
MLNEDSKYIGQCDNIRSCRFNKNNIDFFKNIDTEKWWEDTLKNSSEISKKDFLLNVNPHEILDSDESFDDFLNNLSDTYNFFKTNNIYFIKTSGTNGFEWFWVVNNNLNESLLTEKLTNVDSDVDLLYNKYFKTDIDELNKTGIIRKEMFEEYQGDNTNILNSEDSIKANETNICELIINNRLGNAYRPSTKTIFLSANRNAINYVLNEFNGDYNDALDSLKGGNQYNSFKMEFTEERIKGSIHHELAHWIDDTNNNQHIYKRTEIASKLGTRDINNVPVDSTKMEIQGQIHNIKQVYNKYKENWNELSLRDLFNLTPTLNIVFNNLKDSFKKQWVKDLILRMNRENLLGDKMKLNNYYTLNENNTALSNSLKPNILNYLGIEGKVTKKEIEDLQKEIESNYNDVVPGQNIFNKRNDIRQNMFNYEHPLAQADINGVNLRIAEGLIRDKKKTYLLYADGKLIGEFNSVKDIKTLVKYIQERLIKNTLNEENSDLKGTILKIVSPNIQKHLDDLIKQYGDKAEIIKHIVSAIDDKPEYSLTYEYAKKIKNYFDNFKGNNTSEEYQLHGGIKLKNYINLILAMKRDSISTGKDIRKNMTILNNTHLKSHDKSTIGLTRNPMALKEHIELIENYIPTKKASCGVILNPEKSILLVKRGVDTKWFPGKWALVGGKVDGDEEFKDAFIREVKEETNLDLDFIKYCYNKHDGDCEVALFVAITKTPNDIKINKEHSEYKWCTANEIKELDCVPHIYEDISECLKLLINNKEDLSVLCVKPLSL